MSDRQPAYKDTDLMPFGKHKNERMQDVPASYLCWLWGQRPLSNSNVENYIANNLAALKQEHPDGMWGRAEPQRQINKGELEDELL